MKKTFLIFCFAGIFFAPFSIAQDQLLDQSFGINGVLKTRISDEAKAYALLIQADEKIIAAGTSTQGSFTLSRYDKTGQPDPTFGLQGIQTTPFGEKGAAFALAQQKDKKIIAAGFVHTNKGDDFALVRYLPNGNLDPSFNKSGKVQTHFHFFDGINAVAVQEDQKILVAGSAVVDNNQVMVLARYLPNGLLDRSFGKEGKLISTLKQIGAGAHAMALQKDGKIVLAGFSLNHFDFNFALLRFLPDGKPDLGFGDDGLVLTDYNQSSDLAYAMVLQKDEKIVLGGLSNSDFALARYHKDGTLDNGFGNRGWVSTDLGGRDGINALALQKDGKIIAVGFSLQDEDTEMADADFAIARFHANGTLEQQFKHHLGGNEIANAAALQSDGKLVVAGFSTQGAHTEFALSRYLSTLSTGTYNLSNDALALSIYPNPIKNSAILDYTLPSASEVSIQLYDLQGKYLCTFLAPAMQSAGKHQTKLSFKEEWPQGTYSIVMKTDQGQHTLNAIIVE